MKTFRIVGLIILALIIAFFIGAFFLPTEVKLDKKITVNQNIDSVFELVNDFHNWKEWSPWYDTATTYTITGPKKGKGAIMRWLNKKNMVGERTIDSVHYPDFIRVTTRFREEHSEAFIDFGFTPYGNDSTVVSVAFEMDYNFSYPFGRYVAWMIQKGANFTFPIALKNLKQLAENKTDKNPESENANP